MTPPNTPNKSEKSQVIRLGKAHAARLKEISDKFGTSQAQLVRWAIEALVNRVDKSGGKLTLPYDLDVTPQGFRLAEDEHPYGGKGGSKKP